MRSPSDRFRLLYKMAAKHYTKKRAIISCSIVTVLILTIGLSFLGHSDASTPPPDRFRTFSSPNILQALSSLSSSSYSTAGPLLSPFLIPRVSGTEGNRKVQTHIIDTFKSLNWTIEEDHFNSTTPLGSKPFNNIIVTKNPNASHKLVLAAHYDSKYFSDFDFIGATDSAIPCAILVDIATTLNPLLTTQLELAKQKANDLTLQIIFFDGEEAFVDWTEVDSLYGSRHLAQKWEQTIITPSTASTQNSFTNVLSQIDVLVLLDLLGHADATIFNTQESTTWMWDRVVDIQSRLANAGLMSENLDDVMDRRNGHGYFISSQHYGGQVEDDHVPFMKRGVPIVHAIAQPFPKVWHTKDDTAEGISEDAVKDLALIFRVLVAEYLGLVPK